MDRTAHHHDTRRLDAVPSPAITRTVLASAALAAALAATASGRPIGPARERDPFASRVMQAFLATRAGEITAALYDVRSGRLFTLHPGVREDEASIAKVDILATLLHERGAAPLAGADAGDAAAAIDESDNDAAQDLWEDAGGDPTILAFNAAAGMTQTVLDPMGVWGHDETTAVDQIHLLEALDAPNALLPTPAREYELGLMRAVTPVQAWGVSAGVLAPATAALKNGWLPPSNEPGWQVNSIGIVRGRGRHYLLAVLTEDDAAMAYGTQTIEGISALVWHALSPLAHQTRVAQPPAGSSLAKRARRSISAPAAITGGRATRSARRTASVSASPPSRSTA